MAASQSIGQRVRQLGKLPAVALVVPAGHVHQWQRLPDSVGLFACRSRRCLWCAVCPACLGSLDVALRVREGVPGLVLCWCSVHQEGPDET